MGNHRNISFDLDGTLLCDGNEHLADPEVKPLLGPAGIREDRMRLAALPLLRELVAEGHQIWIYTQSLRGRSEVAGWFAELGVPLDGYVNLQLHEQACEERAISHVGTAPQKCPHWFGIEVHVDDDPEIARALVGSGCEVIVVDPLNQAFAEAVRQGLERLRHQA